MSGEIWRDGMSRRTATIGLLLLAYAASVVGANLMISRLGLVPVGFGLMAPAGVYLAGLTFGLRDALHETGGKGRGPS